MENSKNFIVTKKQIEKLKIGDISGFIKDLVQVGCSLGQVEISEIQGGFLNSNNESKLYILKYKPILCERID